MYQTYFNIFLLKWWICQTLKFDVYMGDPLPKGIQCTSNHVVLAPSSSMWIRQQGQGSDSLSCVLAVQVTALSHILTLLHTFTSFTYGKLIITEKKKKRLSVSDLGLRCVCRNGKNQESSHMWISKCWNQTFQILMFCPQLSKKNEHTKIYEIPLFIFNSELRI